MVSCSCSRPARSTICTCTTSAQHAKMQQQHQASCSPWRNLASSPAMSSAHATICMTICSDICMGIQNASRRSTAPCALLEGCLLQVLLAMSDQTLGKLQFQTTLVGDPETSCRCLLLTCPWVDRSIPDCLNPSTCAIVALPPSLVCSKRNVKIVCALSSKRLQLLSLLSLWSGCARATSMASPS